MLPLRKLITASEFCESGGTGRRARLRGVWFFHTGSSPVSRTKATALQWLFYFITAFECLSFPSRRASLRVKINRCYFIPAGMAELVDALDSGSSEFTLIQVQVLLPAPYRVFITKVMNTRYFFAYNFLFGAGFLLFFFCYAVVGR